MKNKEKFLIALASFSFFLIVYLVIVMKEVKVPDEKIVKEEEKIEKVDLVMLKENYQETAKNIYSQLKNITQGGENVKAEDSGELTAIKDRLMSLIVPEEHKSFHLSMVMLIDGVISNNYVLDEEFQNEIAKIEQDNKWLN